MMQNVKHMRVFRALLVALALFFAIGTAAPTAQAAPLDAGQQIQSVVTTDKKGKSGDALSDRITGDPEGAKQDIHAANLYLPVLRWNGLTGNYHSRYSSDAWDRGDAESSGLSTMARSILQFGDALWSFTATTVNLSSSVDVYSSIGSKIDGVLARIGQAMFNGGAGASSSVIAILIGANVIYAFNKSRKSGGYAPLKDLLGKVCITGFIAFLVFGAAAGGSPSEKIVGGIVGVVDKVGATVASTADDTLAAVSGDEQARAETSKEEQIREAKRTAKQIFNNTAKSLSGKNSSSSGKKALAGGCDEYVKTLHRLYKKVPGGGEETRNYSVIIDSLSKIWESSAVPVWQNIQFRTTPGPANEQIDISNTWCHTAESLTQQSAARQAYTLKNSSNYPDTTGRSGWYAFASGVAGGSKNRDQAIMFWTACRNSGSTWKMDPKAKLLLKDSSKGDQACKDFWEGSKNDKNLDPNANTPAKTVKDAMNYAWTRTLQDIRTKTDARSEGEVLRGAKSFDDWCSSKRTGTGSDDNLDKESKVQARWANYFFERMGIKKLRLAAEKDPKLSMYSLKGGMGLYFNDNRDALAADYAKNLKAQHKDLDEAKAKEDMLGALNRGYNSSRNPNKTHIVDNNFQFAFCELRSLDPNTAGGSEAESLTMDNPKGEPFDWAPSDGGALTKLVDQGSAGEGAASFISSVQSPNWGAGLYGIAVLYVLSSAIVFVIFTAMGVSILIAKSALMLMTLALGLMLIPAIIPGVNTGEKFKKVFITLVGFAGVAAVMMLAVSVVTIISKIMVDVGVGILPANSSFSVLWAGIAPGATIVGLNMLLKKIGMPSPLSIKGALSWGGSGGSMLKGAMAGAAAAKAASTGRSLASRAGASIGRSRRNNKLVNAMKNQQKGSKNAEPEPLPAKNSQAAWDKKGAIGRGIARAKTGIGNSVKAGYSHWTQNSKLGAKVAWANKSFASEWNATKGQRGIWRVGAASKAWAGSMRASRGGAGAQAKYHGDVINARKAKQTMPKATSVLQPAMPPKASASSAPPAAPGSSGGGYTPRPSGGSAPSFPSITGGGGSSSRPTPPPAAAPAARYRGSTPNQHPSTVTPKRP